MKLKKLTAVFICLMLVFSTVTAFANEDKQNRLRDKENTSGFRFLDIGSDHWAYQAICSMVDRKIISGYPDRTFKPDKEVNREEFAKIMVVALNLPIKKPDDPTFIDVKENSWAFPYVETAKFYLTAFRSPQGDYFKPKEASVREDMAVALVKALDYTNEAVDESVLNVFADKDRISPKLAKYIAIAVKRGIMQGSPIDNSDLKAFKPQSTLTRAQAAVLLYKIMGEEKVTYEDDKYTPPTEEEDEPEQPDIDELDDDEYSSPNLTGGIREGKIVLYWEPINNPKLQGYKVVISRNNPNPKYPDDGYLYWITDKTKSYAIIDNREPYKNGDFGEYLTPGKTYYFSITAVYDDEKIPSNVIKLAFPSN